MELKANSSNNTIFADADGDIAYFHGNYIPRRDTKFDWTKPVDGSNPETEWQGSAQGRRNAASAESEKRMAVQLEQLAVVRRGPEQSRSAKIIPRMWRTAANRRAACTRYGCLQGKKDFTRRFAHRRGLRQLSYVV